MMQTEEIDNLSNDSDEMVHSNSSGYDENGQAGNCVSYGPIRVYGRKGKAPTLSTGRRSKFEQLQGEELIQREYRREKNRLLSKKLKEKRETIENELSGQLTELEKEHEDLLNQIEKLQIHKNDLYHRLENIQEDPLFSLIYRTEITLFFEQYDHSAMDTMNIISTLTE